jgi:hypothetical protein
LEKHGKISVKHSFPSGTKLKFLGIKYRKNLTEHSWVLFKTETGDKFSVLFEDFNAIDYVISRKKMSIALPEKLIIDPSTN